MAAAQVLGLVFDFYREPLDEAETAMCLFTDSKHAERLRDYYQRGESMQVTCPRRDGKGGVTIRGESMQVTCPRRDGARRRFPG